MSGGSVVPGSPTQQTFRLGDAATAILDTADGQLTIVTVALRTPAGPWSDAEQDDRGDDRSRSELESAGGEVRFEASLVRGVMVVLVAHRR